MPLGTSCGCQLGLKSTDRAKKFVDLYYPMDRMIKQLDYSAKYRERHNNADKHEGMALHLSGIMEMSEMVENHHPTDVSLPASAMAKTMKDKLSVMSAKRLVS